MIAEQLLILPTDKAYALNRIAQLENEIMSLGPEFYEAFNQTSETWHDNAPFEVVRDKQSVMNAELHSLRRTLRNSSISIPPLKKSIVGIGSHITVLNTMTKASLSYFIAGDWTPFAGEKYEETESIIISRRSPIGSLMLNLRLNDSFVFRNTTYTIQSIEYFRSKI